MIHEIIQPLVEFQHDAFDLCVQTLLFHYYHLGRVYFGFSNLRSLVYRDVVGIYSIM